MKRKIIRIDESKCTGCGLCIPNCAEGSLEIRNGKAVLVKEALCDGLGACLGHCPEGALIIEEREADAFDENLVEERLKEIGRAPEDHAPAHGGHHGHHGHHGGGHGHHHGHHGGHHGGGCPSSRPMAFGGCPSARVESRAPAAKPVPAALGDATPSALGHWPVQLGLLPPTAPFFKGADLLLAADCTAFAYPDFHRDFLAGHAVAVACPKLDDADAHYKKLVDLFRYGGAKSVTILRMEVPCCGGLSAMATHALKESGAEIPLREVVIGRHGDILSDTDEPARKVAP